MLRSRTPARLATLIAGLVVAAGLVTVSAPTPAFAIDSPSSLVASDAPIPVLSWQRVAGATGYEVQLSRVSDFATTIATVSTGNQRYVPQVEMPTGEVWWRVRAKSGSTTGDWTISSFNRDSQAAPVMVTPDDGGTFKAPTMPRFTWRPVAGATSYTVQTSTDHAFTDPALIAENKQQTTAAYLTTYPEVGGYYWRVRAELGTGFATAWSSVRAYRVEGLDPVVRTSPEDVFDKDDARDVFLTDVVLDWEPRKGASTFELRIDTDRNFLSVDHSASGIVGTRYSPPSGLKNDDYFWQVRPVNASGRAAPWPDTSFKFTRAWTDQPQPVYPIGSLTTGVPVFYEWEPIEHASSYTLFVTGPDEWSCSVTTIHTTVADEDCTPDKAGTYVWRVQGNDDGAGVPTVNRPQDYRTFDYAPPTAPPAPTTPPTQAVQGQVAAFSGVGAYGIGVARDVCIDGPQIQCDDLRQTPLLAWDPVPGATSYKVVITNDAEGTNPHSTWTVNQPMWTPTASFNDSQAGSAYYWRVLPCNAKGCGPQGSQHAFAKESVAPAPISPVDDAVVANDVTLTWDSLLHRMDDPDVTADAELMATADTDAKAYVVQVSANEAFSPIIETKIVEQTTYTAFSTTYPEGPIWWRVAAIDGSGKQTVWSDKQQFTKRSPKPTLLTPLDEAPLGQDFTLSWDALEFAKSYDVEVYAGATRVATGTTVHSSWAPSTPFAASASVYTWRVLRTDASNRDGEWTDLRSFRFEGFAPSQTAPAAGGVVAPSGALFSWEPDAKATNYRFERRRPGTSDLAENVTTRATSWAPTTALAAGTAQWRVTALDTAGKTLGSSPWRDFVVIDPPAVATPVAITGTGKVGTDLRLTAPTFDPIVDATAYQWYRGTSTISGATGEAYTLTGADIGKVITVRATGLLAGYQNATSTSNGISGVTGDAPVASAAPTITGSPTFGETLGVTPGSWSNSPTLRYQWYRDLEPISRATGTAYALTSQDVGHSIHVQETASAPGRSDGTATSTPVTIEAGPAPVAITAPQATPDPAVVGATLNVTNGTWSANGSFSYQWFRDGVPLPGATSRSYRTVEDDVNHGLYAVVTVKISGREDGVAQSNDVTVDPLPLLVARTPVRVTGSPTAGSTLTADPGSWNGPARFTYQWFRNGVATGAPSSRSTYSVLATEATRRLHVVITATASGYRQGTATSTPVTIAKMASATTLSLSTTRTTAKKRVTATVRVSVSGLSSPGGTVTLYDGSRKLATVKVSSSGTATYKLPKLKAGKHMIKAVYSGSAQVNGSTRTAKLTVTKR